MDCATGGNCGYHRSSGWHNRSDIALNRPASIHDQQIGQTGRDPPISAQMRHISDICYKEPSQHRPCPLASQDARYLQLEQRPWIVRGSHWPSAEGWRSCNIPHCRLSLRRLRQMRI